MHGPSRAGNATSHASYQAGWLHSPMDAGPLKARRRTARDPSS